MEQLSNLFYPLSGLGTKDQVILRVKFDRIKHPPDYKGNPAKINNDLT
jgi:hypothetical protein